MSDDHKYSIDPRLLEPPYTDPSKTDSGEWWNAVLDSWLERHLAANRRRVEADEQDGQ